MMETYYPRDDWDEEPMNAPDEMPDESDDEWQDEEHDVQKEEMKIIRESNLNKQDDGSEQT